MAPPDRTFVMPPYFHDASIMKSLDLALVHAVFTRRGAGRISHGLGYPSRRHRVWQLAFNAIDQKYATGDTVLPAGTKVYRGTLNARTPFSHQQGATVLYFGLDAVISIWAAFERFKWQEGERAQHLPPAKWHGYLHEFTLIEPMRYRYLRASGGTPTEIEPLCSMDTPCVHPQSILHDPHWVLLQELGTELTIPLSMKSHLAKLRHDRVHTVDLVQMMMHQTDCMSQWNPLEAIKQTANCSRKKHCKLFEPAGS